MPTPDYPDFVSSTGYGTVTGLCGVNCYHDFYPFIPGISEPIYSEEELRQMNEQENTPKEFGGKSYTAYEATQRQRALETTMRAQRQKISLLEQGGADEQDIINARGQYRATSAEYSRFSQAMGLPQQRERVTVDGLGNVGRGKTKGAEPVPQIRPTRIGSIRADAVTDQERAELLTRPPESGMIKLEIDELVPCLKDAETGEILPTEISEVPRKELKDFTEKGGWGVDWQDRPKDEYVLGVYLKDDKSPQGLISLRNDRSGIYMSFASTAPQNNKQLNNGKQKYIGVGGHLFAAAVLESVKSGSGGCIYGYAANKDLLDYYIKNFGAQHIPIVHDYQFVIDGKAAMNLINVYNFERR